MPIEGFEHSPVFRDIYDQDIHYGLKTRTIRGPKRYYFGYTIELYFHRGNNTRFLIGFGNVQP